MMLVLLVLMVAVGVVDMAVYTIQATPFVIQLICVLLSSSSIIIIIVSSILRLMRASIAAAVAAAAALA